MYISRAVKYINYYIKTGDVGLAGTSNASGEDQLALDVLSDKVITDNLMICRLVASAASEEKEKEIPCAHAEHGERYSVAFDPLDGSSLVDTNLAVGSIISIYPDKGFIGRTGRDQVAALYALYGPRTKIVYTVGRGVHEFVLNDVGEFTLSRENIKIKDTGKYFAPGNLRGAVSESSYRTLLGKWIDEGSTLRYSGCMVADLNHLFGKGEGIFTYPAAPPKYPQGKLRLLFECNPFAFLAEQAGGSASFGEGDILDIKITELHQRTPIFIGSKKEVKKVVKFFE
jgi:fructose-1,6-bisphosphatase I